MKQNDAVVNRASACDSGRARARENASVAAQARGDMGSSDTHMSNSDTHVCTRGTHICVRLKQPARHAQMRTREYTYLRSAAAHPRKHTHTHHSVHLEHTYVFTCGTLMCSRGTRMCAHLEHNETRVQFRDTCVYTLNTHVFTWNTNTCNTCVYNCARLENNHAFSGAHTCAHLKSKYVVRCKNVHLAHTNVFTWHTHLCTWNTNIHVKHTYVYK